MVARNFLITVVAPADQGQVRGQDHTAEPVDSRLEYGVPITDRLNSHSRSNMPAFFDHGQKSIPRQGPIAEVMVKKD
jgi:hypothetical protein